MNLDIKPLPPPLRICPDGAIRVGQTRVTLNTVLTEYRAGSSPEKIARDFDALQLADVYGVIAYYLANQSEVDAYLRQTESRASALRAQIEERKPQAGLKDRLLARRAPQEASDAATRGG